MGVFSGELISVLPTTVKVGLPVSLVVKYWVATSSWLEVLNGWYTNVKITLNGMEGTTPTHWIIAKESKSFSDMVTVGPDVMPSHNLNGYVSIKCLKGDLSPDYEIVYYEPISIRAEGVPGDGDGVPPAEEKFPIIPFAAGVGGLLVVVAAVTRKRNHLTKRK